MISIKKKTIGLLVFYLLYLKCLNVFFMTKFTKTFTLSKHQVG